VYYQRAAFCCFAFGAKGLNVKDIPKEILPAYDGKCLSRKAVHNWVEKRCKPFTDEEEVETELRTWLKQQSKDFYVACFDALVIRLDKYVIVDEEYAEN
jgi:hypothetical protein